MDLGEDLVGDEVAAVAAGFQLDGFLEPHVGGVGWVGGEI